MLRFQHIIPTTRGWQFWILQERLHLLGRSHLVTDRLHEFLKVWHHLAEQMSQERQKDFLFQDRVFVT